LSFGYSGSAKELLGFQTRKHSYLTITLLAKAISDQDFTDKKFTQKKKKRFYRQKDKSSTVCRNIKLDF
jgi:hypothetical protein